MLRARRSSDEAAKHRIGGSEKGLADRSCWRTEGVGARRSTQEYVNGSFQKVDFTSFQPLLFISI